jgi:hypothetical protein
MLSLRTLGLALLFTGGALPAIVYVGGKIYLAHDSSYGGPPNQGAIFQVYFALQISIAAGACMALAGLVTSITSLRKGTRHA